VADPLIEALNRNKDDVQQMTCRLRQSIVVKKPSPILSDEVECDEVSLVVGYQGRPDEVVYKGGAAGTDGSSAKANR
jgi:hypothetical protein